MARQMMLAPERTIATNCTTTHRFPSKGSGWTKENVLSVGKPFVTQLGDILWQLDGHHEKLAAQQCAVPTMFSEFQGYNTPENYKQKRPNLKRENASESLWDYATG